MTELSPATAPPLHTDDDVARRVAALIGYATGSDKLWLLFVDGDDRQAPVVVPIEDLPGPPDGEVVAGLGDVLEGFLPELATATGAGSVVFVRERPGPDFVLPDDRAWAEALGSMCRERKIRVRGVHLSTRCRTQRIS
jgi:hypothetical protein